MNQAPHPQKKGMTGNALKMIAIVAMAIDHIAAVLIETGSGQVLTHGWELYFTMRTIGRVAFPIFCYLLVEGFIHTKNRKKYGLRLLLFALISEIPFDLAFYNTWFYPEYQNVFFTLLIGLIVLCWYEKAAGDPLKQSLSIVIGCGASVFLQCDYNIIGIVMILIFYVFKEKKVIMFLFGGILSAIESISCFGAAALAMIPIYYYNGEKGKRNIKYFFYWFYPTHLTLLFLLKLLIAMK